MPHESKAPMQRFPGALTKIGYSYFDISLLDKQRCGGNLKWLSRLFYNSFGWMRQHAATSFADFWKHRCERRGSLNKKKLVIQNFFGKKEKIIGLLAVDHKFIYIAIC